MLGAHLAAEMNNFGCPWGATYSEEQLEANVAENDAEVERLITLARHHDDLVFAVAVGNEATVDWTDHFVPVERMIEHVRRVKHEVPQPVTFCENYVPWQDKLRPLVKELDFISLHTYPVWEYKHVHDALHYSRENYHSVASLYPDKPVVISEAGWATNSNGRGICPENTSQDLQAIYYEDLMAVDGQRRHPDLRLRGVRRAVERLAGPDGAREALGLVHGGPGAEEGHAVAVSGADARAPRRVTPLPHCSKNRAARSIDRVDAGCVDSVLKALSARGAGRWRSDRTRLPCRRIAYRSGRHHMTFLKQISLLALAACLGLVLVGCQPSDPNSPNVARSDRASRSRPIP